MNNEPNAHQNTKPGWGFALLFGGAGAAMMVGMALVRDGLEAPLWVAEIAACTFVMAGLTIFFQWKGWMGLQRLAALGVVYCLSVPGLWIMAGADTGTCISSLGFLSREASNLECRIVFGIGGLITLAIAIGMTVAIMRMLFARYTSRKKD
ncbi:MAG: hypothetical protein KDJ19_06360 [Hyphomicrobiaceae bacterium]|nr:hypothetical protein [Hyphomicrobiaceae bacterium]MCC0024031.1 hypothetical protein [Hyphomicrobiaceae bacterium]